MAKLRTKARKDSTPIRLKSEGKPIEVIPVETSSQDQGTATAAQESPVTSSAAGSSPLPSQDAELAVESTPDLVEVTPAPEAAVAIEEETAQESLVTSTTLEDAALPSQDETVAESAPELAKAETTPVSEVAVAIEEEIAQESPIISTTLEDAPLPSQDETVAESTPELAEVETTPVSEVATVDEDEEYEPISIVKLCPDLPWNDLVALKSIFLYKTDECVKTPEAALSFRFIYSCQEHRNSCSILWDKIVNNVTTIEKSDTHEGGWVVTNSDNELLQFQLEMCGPSVDEKCPEYESACSTFDCKGLEEMIGWWPIL